METNEKSLPKTILIVEDDIALSTALHDTFIQEGYTVWTAGDGRQGLDVIYQNHPTIVLLDIMMPIMDGITLLKTLNENPAEPQSHIFLFSNLSDTDKIAEALQLGAEGYFVKAHTSIDEILDKVHEVIIKPTKSPTNSISKLD